MRPYAAAAFLLALPLLLAGCDKSVELVDSQSGARTVCAPSSDAADADGGGPFGLPRSVCSCVAYFRARGWDPVPGRTTAPLESCAIRP